MLCKVDVGGWKMGLGGMCMDDCLGCLMFDMSMNAERMFSRLMKVNMVGDQDKLRE